jgi:hypothetical protein
MLWWDLVRRILACLFAVQEHIAEDDRDEAEKTPDDDREKYQS